MKKHFNFIGNKKLFYLITAVLLVLGALCIVIRGFNWGIDFVGGTTMQFHIGSRVDPAEAEKIADLVAEAVGADISVADITVQGSGTAFEDAVIKCPTLNTEQRDAAFDAVRAAYNLTDADRLSVENVDPTVGVTLRNAAIWATAVATVLMLAYITIRFEFFSGIAAVICLLHDIFIMLAFYSLLEIPMNITVIATILTILGYSINACVINFDRIRDNLKTSPRTSFDENANTGINETLRRSINTTVAILLAITMMYITGVQSVREFALPLIIGITAGLYSSIFLAGPLWSTLRKALGRKKKPTAKANAAKA